MDISFDPNTQARGTKSLQVEMVRRISDNEVIEVKSWLHSQTEGSIHALRSKIRQKANDENFVCFYCNHTVLLRKHVLGGHYFAHTEKDIAEKARCVYQQDSFMSHDELNRVRYQGQREGKLHIRIKELIEGILESDTHFENIKVEHVWKTFDEGWRKPDVSANYQGIPVVFEAQISNTYPQIVAERTDFYRSQKALLIWIYPTLDNSDWRTLHADNFCSNGQHLFHVDDECLKISREKKEAHFKIYTQKPEVFPSKQDDGNQWTLEIQDIRSIEILPFSSLSLDLEKQTAVYFDIEQERWRSKHKHLCSAVRVYRRFKEELKESIFEGLGRRPPITPETLAGWALLICSIESKKTSTPIGPAYPNFNSILNLLYDSHPQFLTHLIITLEALNLESEETRQGAWKERVSLFKRNKYKKPGEGISDLPKQHTQSFMLLERVYPQVKMLTLPNQEINV